MDPLIIVFGLGVGVLIGMTGIGGGSLMTPLLIIFAGIQPTVAIGTDLAYGATHTAGCPGERTPPSLALTLPIGSASAEGPTTTDTPSRVAV